MTALEYSPFHLIGSSVDGAWTEGYYATKAKALEHARTKAAKTRADELERGEQWFSGYTLYAYGRPVERI